MLLRVRRARPGSPCRTRRSHRSARTGSTRGPACRSTRPRPAGRSRRRGGHDACARPARAARSPSWSSQRVRLGGRLDGLVAPLRRRARVRRRERTVPLGLMLPGVNSPRNRFEPLYASSPARSVTSSVAACLRLLDDGLAGERPLAAGMIWSNRPLPPPRTTSTLVLDGLLRDRARPAGRLRSCGQVVMSSRPWQPRRRTCELSTAGVASVISAVVDVAGHEVAALGQLEDRLEILVGARRRRDAVVGRLVTRSPRRCRSTRSRGRSRASTGRSPGPSACRRRR